MYANGPWTTPPLLSLFTGESPAAHRVFYEWSVPRPDSPGIVKTLCARGWNAPNLSYLNRLGMYANVGYDTADAPEPPHVPDDETLVRAIQETPEPWFLWFHYKWVHLPYWHAERYRRAMGIDDGEIPERLRNSVCTGFVVPRGAHQLLPEDEGLVRRLYASGVLEMNDWLARVLDAATTGPAGERTTIVLTADHGEELLDHGHVGHASTAHAAMLYEEVLRIPLLVVDPRVRRGRTTEARVQSLDLHSTILGLAGAPTVRGEGIDLGRAILAGEEPIPERVFSFHSARMGCPTPREREGQVVEGVSDGRTKLVRERWDGERVTLYDLAADPKERTPLDSDPRIAEWLPQLAG
jgi:arylsulfatase A-like enzyme